MRSTERSPNEMRDLSFTRNFTSHAEGSVLVEYGNTRVLCTASVVSGVPRFLRDASQGWMTAEYGMLPRATSERTDREAVKGKQGGRTVEIQRLIGRALRSAVDLKAIGQNTIHLDCDVLQADGGTRTASISGACVALVDALRFLQKKGTVKELPLKHLVAAVSVGIYNGTPVLDLDYAEDSKAHTDMNVVMTEAGSFVEIQGTAESEVFHEHELISMLALAKKGISQIIAEQKRVLGLS